MAERANEILEAALARLLRPLVRILLRRGVPFKAFAEVVKTVYVDVARRDFGLPGRAPSRSRVAVLTGLTRKEVKRLMDRGPAPLEQLAAANNRAAAVLSGWLRDPDWHDGAGQPAALAVDGEKQSFASLVRRYSGDAPPRAVLDELLRVGAVRLDARGRVVPAARGYVPAAGDAEKLSLLGDDAADLLGALDHNLEQSGIPYLQRRVAYDNLPEEALPELRRVSRQAGQELLERLDREFARRDRDINRELHGTGRKRVAVGVYYYEEDSPVGREDGEPLRGPASGTRQTTT